MEDVKQKILVVTEAYTLSDNEERNQGHQPATLKMSRLDS